MEPVKATSVLSITNWKGKRVIVFGFGRSGQSVAGLLREYGAQVTIVEEQISAALEDTAAVFRQRGISVVLGSEGFGSLEGANLLVLSPGISRDHLLVQEAAQRSIPIVGEIEIAGWFLQAPIIAVTGTNGKSTTVQLIGSILQQSGKTVFVGGNLGVPLCEAVGGYEGSSGSCPYDFIVAEVSSFQLETIQHFKPWIAVLLNMTSDHLDRHVSYEDYRAAKRRIFESQTIQDWALINVDDSEVRSMAADASASKCEFSLIQKVEQGVYLEDNVICARMNGESFPVVNREEIPMLGDHNVANAMAAIGVALLCGCSMHDIVKALQSPPTFEHALERVREWRGITFVNDSKGTNVDATLKAVDSFHQPLILILGGKDKGGDFSRLADRIRDHVKELIVIGEATQIILQALGQIKPVRASNTLSEAVSYASSIAESGEVVLFSPACSSFDMFQNYHHRGLEFKRLVKELP